MNIVNLSYTVVTDPDSLVGFKYYVKAGEAFHVDDYCAAYKLDRAELDASDVAAVELAVGMLAPGEWLQVSHSVAA